MTYDCPKGCKSSDAEFCSECGTPINSSAVAPIAPPTMSGDPVDKITGEICPDCGSVRKSGDRFCEVCRYDFVGGTSNLPSSTLQEDGPGDAPSIAPPATRPSPPAIDQNFSVSTRLNVVIQVDPTLVTDEVTVPCPTGIPDKLFPLDLEENLIGRRSESKQIYPEIEVNDPGVSRRHFKLLRQLDGSFAALELGSANGTHLNGASLEAGIMTPIHAGDEFTLGNWTRLKVVGR